MTTDYLAPFFDQVNTRKHGTALIDDHRQLTYSQLGDAVKKTAQWIEINKANVVAILADNCISWVVADLAAQFAGVVCLPIPLFFSREQIDHCVKTAGVDLLVYDDSAVDDFGDDSIACPLDNFSAVKLHANCIPPSMPKNTGKITFTSGSTGTPKGVCLRNQHVWQVAQSLAEAIAISQPRHLCLLPLATLLENIAGIYAPLLCGGRIYLPSGKTRGLCGSTGLDVLKICRTLTDTQPNTLITIPQLLSALLVTTTYWSPPDSLRFVAVGGARVDPELLIAANRAGIPAYEGYGLSECGSVVALNTPTHTHTNYCGKVLSHCRVTIEQNDVIVHGSCFLGYLSEPSSWYPTCVDTGDVGALTADGWLTINGRKKNQIITSFGRNINPEWVESVLLSKPLLNHCVVVGESLPFLVAIIGVQDAIGDAQVEQWIHSANQKLPDYAQVQQFIRIALDQWQHFLTANGRPRRKIIEQQCASQIDACYRHRLTQETS